MTGIIRDFSIDTQNIIRDILKDDYDNYHNHIINGLHSIINNDIDYHYADINNDNNINMIKEYYFKLIEANEISQKEYENLIEKVYDIDQVNCWKAKVVSQQIYSFSCFVYGINSAFQKNDKGKYIIELEAFRHINMDYYISLIDQLYKYGFNPVFDDIGKYGGDQRDLHDLNIGSNQFNEAAKIVRKYEKYAQYTDEEIYDLLFNSAEIGCAYMAMVNTIFDKYIGKEDDFKEIFGYPMYFNDELNYVAVFIDFYCYAGFEGYGIGREDREKKWEEFCGEHKIKVNVENVSEMNKEIFESYQSKGVHVNIQLGDFNLLNTKGEIVGNNIGYHAMSVTGIMDDGKIMVSSWGGCYFIDPDKPAYAVMYQIVDYN